jgi:AraC family transcriptional regulator
MVRRKLLIKNMSGQCCVKLIRRLFREEGFAIHSIENGEAEISFDQEQTTMQRISELLQKEGFELITDKEDQLVEQIKNTVINLVHHSTYNAMVRNSDYLVERFNLSYQHISSIFSKNEHITLEKFIIRQKIEKVKELIRGSELSLSEIAYMMGYSSVQYLSTQFKHITGITVSEFKKGISSNDD